MWKHSYLHVLFSVVSALSIFLLALPEVVESRPSTRITEEETDNLNAVTHRPDGVVEYLPTQQPNVRRHAGGFSYFNHHQQGTTNYIKFYGPANSGNVYGVYNDAGYYSNGGIYTTGGCYFQGKFHRFGTTWVTKVRDSCEQVDRFLKCIIKSYFLYSYCVVCMLTFIVFFFQGFGECARYQTWTLMWCSSAQTFNYCCGVQACNYNRPSITPLISSQSQV